MRIFKKKPVEPQVTHKEARDMWSFAFHIVDMEEKALCGAKSAMYGTTPTTPERVLGMVDKQHGGWHWCSACGSAFTGQPVEAFRFTRK